MKVLTDKERLNLVKTKCPKSSYIAEENFYIVDGLEKLTSLNQLVTACVGNGKPNKHKVSSVIVCSLSGKIKEVNFHNDMDTISIEDNKNKPDYVMAPIIKKADQFILKSLN